MQIRRVIGGGERTGEAFENDIEGDEIGLEIMMFGEELNCAKELAELTVVGLGSRLRGRGGHIEGLQNDIPL